jgi:small-conductance mechanosensitive channel
MYQLANLILRASSFMGAKKWQDYQNDPQWGWVYNIVNAVYTILGPILAIVAAAGVIWAIVLGINMARADSQDKRDEAKKRLISLIVGIVILVVLIVFFYSLFPLIMNSFLPEESL